MASPTSGNYRLEWGFSTGSTGALIGSLVVYAANQVRIISLYYCLRYQRSLFETMHGYIAPLLLITVATLFFVYWIENAEPPLPE